MKNDASLVEDRRIVTYQQATTTAKPSAATVIPHSVGSQNTRHTTNQLRTCKTQTQTDLTWRLSFDRPLHTSNIATRTNLPLCCHLLNQIFLQERRGTKSAISAQKHQQCWYLMRREQQVSSLRWQRKTAKAPPIFRPLPSRYTDDSVTMYNKYGILDPEGVDSHFSDT